MPATRSTYGRPCPEERRENAALRNHVRKTFEKAQQEEAFKELLNTMGANGGKVPYGAVSQIMKKYQINDFKAVTRQSCIISLKRAKNVTQVAVLWGRVFRSPIILRCFPM